MLKYYEMFKTVEYLTAASDEYVEKKWCFEIGIGGKKYEKIGWNKIIVRLSYGSHNPCRHSRRSEPFELKRRDIEIPARYN
jgi:hypothetical protein